MTDGPHHAAQCVWWARDGACLMVTWVDRGQMEKSQVGRGEGSASRRQREWSGPERRAAQSAPGVSGCRGRSRQLPRHGEGRSIAEAAEQSHGGPLCRRRGVRGRWQQADGKGAPARPVDPEPHRRPWVRSCIFDLPNSASDGRSSPHLSCTCAYSQVSACPPPDWGRRCRKVSRPADRRHPTGSEGSPRDQPDPRSGALKP